MWNYHLLLNSTEVWSNIITEFKSYFLCSGGSVLLRTGKGGWIQGEHREILCILQMLRTIHNTQSPHCHGPSSGVFWVEARVNSREIPSSIKFIFNSLNTFSNFNNSSSAWDPDPLDPQDFGFLDPDPQKYANPWIQGPKYQPKTAKKIFTL